MKNPFDTPVDAQRAMARSLTGTSDGARLRSVLATRAEFFDLSRMNDAQVRAQVAALDATGRLSRQRGGALAVALPSVQPAPEEVPDVVPPPKKAEVKPDQKLTASFEKQKCHCGDEIKLKATSENIPDGPIKFELKQAGKVVGTVSGKLAANAAETPWKSKVATNQRPEPAFELIGKAAGQTAPASQTLTIEKYADVASETKTIACASGIFGWTGKFDLELKDGQVVVTVKVKLLNRLGPKPATNAGPLPALGAAVSDDDKLAMKTDVESKLSNKHVLHRKDCKRGDACDCDNAHGCCKMRVKVVVDFVEAGAHHNVNLFQGAGQADSGNWLRVKTRPNSYAHETGHLLGWYDEYAVGAVGTAPRWKVQESVVMNTGLTVPKEYYWDFRDWLKAKTGEDWVVLSP